MKLYFVRDEKKRILRQFATLEKPDGIVYSDTFSYAHVREMYKGIGQVMGLEKFASRVECLLLMEKNQTPPAN